MLELKINSLNPRKIGEIHGEAFKKEIKELLEIRFGLLNKFLKGWTLEEITSICLESYAALSEHEELFEEFEGLREASDLSATELMILNNYTDLRDFSANDNLPPGEDGCSALSLHAPRLRWAGQTWDMHASATPYTLLLHLKDGTEVLTVAGCLGLAGLNQHGLSVLINNMHCREFTDQNIPWPALVRLLLKEQSAPAAVKLLQKTLPCSGHNYLICDEKTSINVETTGIRSEITGSISGSNGYLLHTNHYVGSLSKLEIMERQSPTTHRRLQALEKFFKDTPLVTITEEQIKKEVFLDGKTAKEICIPKDATDPHKAMTCGGLMVNYSARTFEAFSGLYKDNDRIKISF
jgi:isopenicillin-N N-acyltransferase like protein